MKKEPVGTSKTPLLMTLYFSSGHARSQKTYSNVGDLRPTDFKVVALSLDLRATPGFSAYGLLLSSSTSFPPCNSDSRPSPTA
jgi:hypothetical protein